MSVIRLGRWAILVAFVFAVPSWSGEPPKEHRSAKAHVDLYGDPLPNGAVVRLGSLRFRHPGAVWEVAFSPDGKLLAASSDGYNMVILWERATGRAIRAITLDARPGFQPTHLRFSADGKRLYGCSWYGQAMSIYAWDVESGKDAKDVPAFPGEMRTLGYSPDSREMLLLHRGADVVRWDIDKGKELGRYSRPGNRNKHLSTAALVGEHVLVPYFDGEAVGMWDVAQKKKLWSVKTTRDKNDSDPPMAFSADGKLFAIEASPKAISVYESVTAKRVRQLKGDVGDIYYSLCISSDGRLVVGRNRDDTFRLWDLESGRERFRAHAILNCVPGVFLAPDSKVFASGGPNHQHAVLLWDTAAGKQVNSFPGHTSPVSWVSFSPDGRRAATCSWIRGDPVVRLWDTRTGRLLRSLDPLYAGGVTAVAFSPDGEKLAASHWAHWKDETKVRIWNVRTGRELHALTGHVRGRDCLCVAFSPDGKRLASGDDYYDSKGEHGGRLCIWDAEAGKLIREIRGTNGSIQQVLFARDGRYIVAAADGVHIYDADTGRLVGKPFQTKARDQKATRVWRLALSADGRLLATADGRLLMRGDGRGDPVRLWELATRREIPLAIVGGDGIGVALTPDGRTLAANSSKGGVVLFHWPSGEVVGKLSGEGGIGSQVFFSPDGRWLATAGNSESTALIWNVAGLVKRQLPAVAKPDEAELRRWWTALSDANPGEAYKAVWRFAVVPEQALPFLAASLQPAKPSKPVDVARLIDDLDSDQFQVREKASRQLRKLGDTVANALHNAKKGNVSAEKARRIEQLLAQLADPEFDPEQLRATRAVAILEQIGGAEARKLLARLAAGAAGAHLTQEAQAGLKRLKWAER